jgi:general stress protein 26
MSNLVKLSDYPSLANYLSTQKAATIAVPIDENGTIHAASLLYWNSLDPLRFYFVTSRESEKYTLLETEKSINCAVVVGTEKGTPFTLQMRGTMQEVDPNEHKEIVESYYTKRGNHQDDIDAPDTCLLEFIPSWARFTDYLKGYDTHELELG